MTPETDRVAALAAELPSHGRWVRALARSLVLDEAAAEDLAQEVQLAALRRPGSIRGALAPWLARVTRNLARRSWRDAGVRARGERAAARPEGLPAADDLCARIEIERRLVTAIAALEPALQRTLVRRYFDGWSAARIAREAGEPAATVRWRLQRGLAELRARLDRGDARDGTEWRLALLPLCGRLAPWSAVTEALRPAGVATLQGVLTMKAASQALALAAVVAAAGLGVWWNATRDGSPRAAAATEPPRVSAELEAPARPAVSLVAEPVAREALPVSSAPAAEKQAPPESAPPLVTGRCVDEQLVPIAGARVSQGDDHGHAETSATDGTFALPARATSWSTCMLVIEAEGFATRVLELPASKETTLLGDVVLRPGGSVRGRVLGPDGAPFRGAKVTVSAPGLSDSLAHARVAGPSGENLPSTLSCDDGRFAIAGIGTGPVRVWAGAEGMLHSVSAPIEVRARRSSEEVELHLERTRRDDRIRGVVVTPEGEPVTAARVRSTERAGSGTSFDVFETDDEGRFEVVVKSGCVYDFLASDGAERWPSVAAKDVLPGQELELRFRASGWIEVRVRDERGEAREDFVLLASTPDGRDTFERADGEHHSGGVARLRVPNEPFRVRVEARGFAPAERGPFSPDAAPAELELELRPEPGVRGRVLAGGEPIAGARVTLHEAPPQQRIDHQGYTTLFAPDAADETTTDAEGRFVLMLRERQFVVVRAQAHGYAASDLGPFEVLPETGRSDLELVLGRGGALEGRVLVAPGHDRSGVIIALNRGDGFPRTVRSDPEGRFAFEGLTSGPWVLSRGRLDFNPSYGETVMWIAKEPALLPFNCEIREGETTYQDLDLRDFEPCKVAGVLTVNGAPVGDWSVTALPGAQPRVGEKPSTATAADGSFEFVIDEAGPLRLSFSWPPALGTAGRFDVLTEIHPGRNDWREDFALGRIVARARSWSTGTGARLYYQTAEGVEPSCWMRIEPADDGSFVLPFVPAGKGSIYRSEGGGKRVPLREVDVVAGKEQALDVP